MGSAHVETTGRQPVSAYGRDQSELVSPVLIGRAEERETLLRAVEATPSMVAVTGEAGLGKSRLIAELASDEALTDRTLLLGGTYRIQEPFPLGPVLEAVRALGTSIGDLPLSPLGGAPCPLLPELVAQLPEALTPLADASAERHRVFRALAEVLHQVPDPVLVLEDLHWADSHTLDFLSFLLRWQPSRLALVLSYRADEAPERLRELVARPPTATTINVITLQPMQVHQTGQLASAILDAVHISHEFASYLCERTGGIPFAIEEVLAVLRERGEISRLGQRWARRELAELAVPTAIRDAVLERLARLSADARRVVEAAAVLQVPIAEPVVHATSNLQGAEAMQALSAAITSGLLVETGQQVGFRHVLAAQAVEEALPGPHRRALHARAADVLGGADSPPLGRLAHHLREAGQLASWADCAERAADQAAALGEDAGAAALLTKVLSEASLDPQRRTSMAGKLARVALYGVSHHGALGPLLRMLEHADISGPDRGELRRGVAQLLAQAGDMRAACDQLHVAASELEGRPASQARAMAALAVMEMPGHHGDRTVWADRALAVLQQVEDPIAETVVRGNRAVTLLSAGDTAWREDFAALRVEASSGGETPPAADAASLEHRRLLARAAHNVGITACYMGHMSEAEQLLQEAADHLRRCGGELPEHAVRAAQVVVQFRLGQWDGLEVAVASLREDLVELPVHRVDVEWVAGCLRLARGDLDGAREHLETAWQLCIGLTAVQVAVPVVAALSRLHLILDDPAEAVACTTECLATATASGRWAPAGPAARVAVDALLAAGDKVAAEELVNQLTDGLVGRDAPDSQAAAHVARGAFAHHAGDLERAAAAYLAAAEAYGVLPQPYESAQAQERAADCLFACHDTRGQQASLSALEIYEQLGATWDAARAARTARRHGLTLPTPYRGGRRGYGSGLSPRERDVARLAAAGCSNQEIADQLFLSTRTVEKHVSRALRKLGAASRRDLRHIAAQL